MPADPTVERFRRALMDAHHHDWSMTTISEAAHICASAADPTVSDGATPEEGWSTENASIEVWRWGPHVRLGIRSETSTGKAIELTLEEARSLADDLDRATRLYSRKVRDEPQA